MDMTTAWTEMVKQLPIASVMAMFAWALLSIVKQVLSHYQTMLSETLGRILAQLDKLEERTRGCPGPKGRDANE